MGITGMHHVAMRVARFDKAVEFYTDVLGLTSALAWGEKGNRAIMLDCGDGSHVEIFEDDSVDTVGETGLLHFALACDDVDGLSARAADAGCKVTVEPKDVAIKSDPPQPVRIAFFKGPNGETVELFQCK